MNSKSSTCLTLLTLLIGCAQQNPDKSVSEPAHAQPARPDIREVAGIELGKPLTVPECKKEKYAGMIMYAMEGVTYPCFKDFEGAGKSLKSKPDLPHGPEHDGMTEIELGSEAVPTAVASTATVMMINGTPEEITLETGGIDEQDRLYGLLVAKYGKPTQSNISELQNAMGARYQSIEAFWQLPTIRVRFYGMLNNPRDGLIVASTPKGDQWLAKRQPKSADSF